MKLPTGIKTRHKIRDSKILSLYATDAWSFEQIATRFNISAARVGQIIYKNIDLLKVNREHEKIKRINVLKRILAKKSEECPEKDKLDVMDKLREECESGSGSDQVGRADTRVIIIRESAPAPASNRIAEVVDGDTNPQGSVSRSVSVVRV